MDKPKKPYQDFPLYAHKSGQWAKKILGKTHYFGSWADPQAALRKYLDQRDDLQAGRVPVKAGATVTDLCNVFMEAKGLLRNSGELSDRSVWDYHCSCRRIVESFGKTATLLSLGPQDFLSLRAQIAKTRGPKALSTEVQRIRTIFKYAVDTNLIDRPVKIGPGFRGASKKQMRRARNQKGRRSFTAEEIRKLLATARQPLRAMIWLGINAAFGPSDLDSLRVSVVDLERGWIRYPRPKTEIQRCCPLWPETRDALRAVIERRPEPANPDDKGLVFLARNGTRLLKFNVTTGTNLDTVSRQFARLKVSAGLPAEIPAFYGLRHTFQTVAEDIRDFVAIRAVMGHTEPDEDMSQFYRDTINESRLHAIVNHVRDWLLGAESAETRAAEKNSGEPV